MRNQSEELFLGVECGGTRTVALLASRDLSPLQRREFGPANLKLLSDEHLHAHFALLHASFPPPGAIGIGMAGARTETDWLRVRKAAASHWPGVPIAVTNDLEISLLAAGDKINQPRILVLSGTGSCCYGKSPTGRTARMGGWGHILGDKGSGYEIGLRGLKASIFYFDRDEHWGELGQSILRQLLLNEPNDLIEWVQKASKREIAGLAPLIFAAAARGEKAGRDIIEGAAQSLAKDAAACARKLTWEGGPVEFILAGGALLKQGSFAERVRALIQETWSNSSVASLEREGVFGAVRLAIQAAPGRRPPASQRVPRKSAQVYVPPLSLQKSPTEQRNPRSKNLDQLSSLDAVRLMLSEEKRVVPALLRHDKSLATGVEMVCRALLSGGRLFYAGAGTSGRLGVLDASECPPTFRADPEQVQGIIAGGERALRQAVEGAEDDPEAGARAVSFRGVKRKDVLIGIAASGRTPFVWGALAEARKRGARTILLCFNPSLPVPRAYRPDLIIAVDLGPEVLTGSTRLKSGTATKLVLNIFSTLGMVRLGKVISNLMIDLNPSNTKLRDRALRIIQELTGVDAEAAQAALEKNGWVVKAAFNELTRKRPTPRAKGGPLKPARKRNAPARSKR